jgi:hypothetical protein
MTGSTASKSWRKSPPGGWDSNPRIIESKSTAFPLGYLPLPGIGFEPMTSGLKVRSSTAELTGVFVNEENRTLNPLIFSQMLYH